MPTVNASATTANVCPCCVSTEPADLECRTRGGTATLCGMSEYTTPSTPPKKYRTQTTNGEAWGCASFSTPSTCSGTANNRFRFVYAGTYLYNVSNCAESNTQTVTGHNFTLGVACTYENGTAQSPGTRTQFQAPELSTDADLVTTPTLKTWTWDGACMNWGGLGQGVITGEVTHELSDEDTEADAYARLLATSNWSAWIAQGATGCTGTPPPCCLAKYEDRTAGFSFVFQESQFRVVAGGLTPLASYNAEVEIFRRAYNSGNYTLYQTLTVSNTTDGSGNYLAEGNVPNDRGFETYASSAVIVL